MSMMSPPGAGNGPGGSPPGMVLPQAPPAGPTPGMPPPGGVLTPPAPPPPIPGAGASTPLQGVPPAPSPYTDLSAKMPHAYQLLDVAARSMQMAIETGGFYKQPTVLAGVRKLESDTRRIIQSYAKGDENDEPRPANSDNSADFNADDLGNEGEDDAPSEGA